MACANFDGPEVYCFAAYAACNMVDWDEGIGVLFNQIRVHCLYEPFNGKGKGLTATSKAGGGCVVGVLAGDVQWWLVGLEKGFSTF